MFTLELLYTTLVAICLQTLEYDSVYLNARDILLIRLMIDVIAHILPKISWIETNTLLATDEEYCLFER